MAINNKNELWEFMSNQINSESEEYCKNNYTLENFLKDYSRSSEELCINGKLAKPILNARNQIEVIQAIRDASAILEKNPEHIKEAYLKMLPIHKDTDQFKTTLESVASIIKKLDGMEDTAKALLTLASNLNSVSGDGSETQYPSFEVTSISENFSQTLLSAGSLDRKKIKKIEAALLDEAANVTFKELFEKKKLLSPDANPSENDLAQHRAQEVCFRSFLKLFLHQGSFIYFNILTNMDFFAGHDVIPVNSERTVDLSYLDDSLFIKVSFFNQNIFDRKTNKLLEVAGDDYFTKGVATYKIDVKPYNLSGWVARVKLMDSVFECKPEYKNILDTISEKFQKYLVTILEKIKACLNLTDSLNSNKTRCNSFFFVSPDGNSAVTKQILDNNLANSGEVLNLVINSMPR